MTTNIRGRRGRGLKPAPHTSCSRCSPAGDPRSGRNDTIGAMRTRFAVLLLFVAATARANYNEFKDLPLDPAIVTKIRHAAEASLKELPKLTADNLAITVVDVTNPSTIARGDYHGDAPFYPASVIKLFF